ncbi:hypothetical protein Ancab_017206 [Ancistrocladus abbreviatus]
MGKIVEKKRKKKGRPSLLDLQRRSIKQQEEQLQKQQQQQEQQKQLRKTHKFDNPNPNSTTTPLRRSTRRNPNPDLTPPPSDAGEDGEDEEDQLSGKRREKQLKFVLKLPNSSLNSGSLNSGSDSNVEDDNTATTNRRKRKANAIRDGSGHEKHGKVQNHESATNLANNDTHQGVKSDDGPSTPLPDKKLLLFILDRLQKKDTYGVFAEPVDPEELPDYHDVIEHPMDFSTVRKKLTSGTYANLEQFERDVFLICSNAMQYNSPDTIYFRQARSIQELAEKNFENLRQDSDDNEPEPKIVRRGRPPTKNLKKTVGKSSLEHATSEVSGATLATGVENPNQSNYDLRRGTPLEKYGSNDSLGRSFHGSSPGEVYISWSADRLARTDQITGSSLKGIPVKHGKKQVILNESRRSTYTQSYSTTGRQESSTLGIFSGERKLLIPVGLHTEYGYARSLARFAAKLGPVAWRVASKKIERCLPSGVKFGPGWVGEDEVVAQRPLVQPLLVTVSQPLPPQHLSQPGNSSSAAALGAMEPNSNKPLVNPESDGLAENHVASHQPSSDGHSSKPPSLSVATTASTVASSPIVASSSKGPSLGITKAVKGFSPHTALNVSNSSLGILRPGPPLQVHQNSMLQHRMNGANGTFAFNVLAQMGKLNGISCPTGLNLQPHSVQGTTSKMEGNYASPPTVENNSNSEKVKKLEKSKAAAPSDCLPNSGLPQPSRHSLLLQQMSESVPPDLNVRFQLPGSPGSGRADSMQPDLALQL